MKAVAWTGFALLAALVIQTTLSQIAPARVQTLDPFLLVVVYCALSGGEVHGMLAGAAAGWGPPLGTNSCTAPESGSL